MVKTAKCHQNVYTDELGDGHQLPHESIPPRTDIVGTLLIDSAAGTSH